MSAVVSGSISTTHHLLEKNDTLKNMHALPPLRMCTFHLPKVVESMLEPLKSCD